MTNRPIFMGPPVPTCDTIMITTLRLEGFAGELCCPTPPEIAKQGWFAVQTKPKDSVAAAKQPSSQAAKQQQPQQPSSSSQTVAAKQ